MTRRLVATDLVSEVESWVTGLCHRASVSHRLIRSTSLVGLGSGVEIAAADLGKFKQALLDVQLPPNYHVSTDVSTPVPSLLRARLKRSIEEWDGTTALCLFAARSAPEGTGLIGPTYGCSLIAAERDVESWTATGSDEELADSAPFPIDIVLTWVDGRDPAWLERRQRYLDNAESIAIDGATTERFAENDELRYCLRSVHQNVPFARRIFLVTDQQSPVWLNTDHPDIELIDHQDIFERPGDLPVFNSHAIESQLHRVPGLAEHYLYVNDDVFFGRLARWWEYFGPSGISYFSESIAEIPDFAHETSSAVDYSGVNARRLMIDTFGTAPRRKIRHTPHTQQRSLHLEMEQMFPELYRQVSRSRFRSTRDVSLAANLHHRYGEATNRARIKQNDYGYVNLARPNLASALQSLALALPATWCLNDAPMGSHRRRRVTARVNRFLESRFPEAAPWEIDAH